MKKIVVSLFLCAFLILNPLHIKADTSKIMSTLNKSPLVWAGYTAVFAVGSMYLFKRYCEEHKIWRTFNPIATGQIISRVGLYHALQIQRDSQFTIRLAAIGGVVAVAGMVGSMLMLDETIAKADF